MTMHGPDGKSYPNENRFTRIIDNQILEVEHLREPHFTLTIELEPEGKGTRVRWRQIFDTAEKYDKLSQFIALANEQNLERLSMEVQRNQSTA